MYHHLLEALMYWLHKRLLSQNFLCNRQLVKQLIRDSSIGKNDTVLEIGAGQGIITQELLEASKQVLAIELDAKLLQDLRHKFMRIANLTLIQGNFLETPLPNQPYKVFSNIPFSITGEVIRKLLQSPNPPPGYLPRGSK